MVPFLAYHERAATTTAIKEMCIIQNSHWYNREAAPKRVERGEGDVRKMLTVNTSVLTSLDEDDDGISSFINIATGMRMPQDCSTPSNLALLKLQHLWNTDGILITGNVRIPVIPEDQNICN